MQRELRLRERRFQLALIALGAASGTAESQSGSGGAATDAVDDEPLAKLSNREREVLRLLTEGDRSPCIATRLNITTATVDVHRRNIMRKLDLHTIAALTKYAVRQGLTSL